MVKSERCNGEERERGVWWREVNGERDKEGERERGIHEGERRKCK